jgi:nucleotide-binding universal stress UspA family protein
MKRILVPVDFSSHTDISCRYAIHLAEAGDTEIVLFHSFFDQFYYSDGGFSTGFESGILMTDEIILDLYKQKEKKLLELAEDLISGINPERRKKIRFTCRMESGNPEVQIIHAIDQLNPGLIVMGSGGMGKKSLMSGSVARRIIDGTKIPVPVIAVPESNEVPDIKNVAYMTTFDQHDPGVIQSIFNILAYFRIEVFCLHLTGSDPDPAAQMKMNSLSGEEALKTFDGRISFHVLENDREKETLQHFIAENQISLISFIPHKRNIFRNLFYQGITKEDLFQTRIPIMAVRPS